MIQQRVRVGSASAFPGTMPEENLRRIPKFLGKRKRAFRSLAWLLVVLAITGSITYEVRTSALQSWVFARWSEKLSYKIEPGKSSSIAFPENGPFDVRSGYALIPEFVQRLESRGYRITRQARFSPELLRWVRWGIVPPFWEPTSTDLSIRDMSGQTMFHGPVADTGFISYEQIPPLITRALLLIENRELEEPADVRTNPVVDWGRLAKATVLYAGRKIGLPLRVEGGSTLATQMEKYRHSNQGRTQSVTAKLQQMAAASLKVYKQGQDTRSVRQEIIFRYLNTVPLAAAPGYGEVFGIDNGLVAWFGADVAQVQRDLNSPGLTEGKVEAFKKILALLCSVRAPTYYLVENQEALSARVDFYTRLLAKSGVISQEFADRLQADPLRVSTPALAATRDPAFTRRKATEAIRTSLLQNLQVPGLYELDRLHLDVDSTIDIPLQRRVEGLFERLQDPVFLRQNGLVGKHLLGDGDPAKVIYGMTLFERTSQGNLLRVEADNFNSPFNINEGMKMQLGSTAKLRTLSHYMQVISQLYHQFSVLDEAGLKSQAARAPDPITRWAAETLQEGPTSLPKLIQKALDRKYSANPGEVFFTGGGVHVFGNFDREDNSRVLTIREATRRSVNLVYIRLMRDLIRYHTARLNYNPDSILSDPENPARKQLLDEIANSEAKLFLRRSYSRFQALSGDLAIHTLLGSKVDSLRRLSILYFAWNSERKPKALEDWLRPWLGRVTPDQVSSMMRAYGNPRLNLADYAYLLGIHPLDLWCAGALRHNPALSWDETWEQSAEARKAASSWLFKTRNRGAQDLRLRIRFEEDAFARMTPFWQKLGFPFERLIPSYATAIGSSGDRPAALAKLMGIILNDGVIRPTYRIRRIEFGRGTPYETAMEPDGADGEQVMPAEAARAVREVLAGTVESGTAVRVAGAFRLPDGTSIVAGGKTGSGDNRFETFSRRGGLISARPVNRTATFVFYIGGRYFGALTAFVPGEIAGNYGFTSSLPVGIMKVLAPSITNRLSYSYGKSHLLVYENKPQPGKQRLAESEKSEDPAKASESSEGIAGAAQVTLPLPSRVVPVLPSGHTPLSVPPVPRFQKPNPSVIARAIPPIIKSPAKPNLPQDPP